MHVPFVGGWMDGEMDGWIRERERERDEMRWSETKTKTTVEKKRNDTKGGWGGAGGAAIA